MRARLVLALVFVVCLCLATFFDPRFQTLRGDKPRTAGILVTLMGDSRKMFANHFFAKADAYFHNGNYPTIFDHAKSKGPSHMAPQDSNHQEDDEAEQFEFRGKPKDWIEAFGRRFMYTEHSHLEAKGQAREILPWLRISADMDPHRVETYVTAAFWLRKQLGKPDEAEQFLREGLRANPDSYEILLELGCVYDENKKDSRLARNLWNIALEKWRKQDDAGAKPDKFVRMKILGHLVQVEEREGKLDRLIYYLQELKKVSPVPEAIEKQIQDAAAKLNSHSP